MVNSRLGETKTFIMFITVRNPVLYGLWAAMQYKFKSSKEVIV